MYSYTFLKKYFVVRHRITLILKYCQNEEKLKKRNFILNLHHVFLLKEIKNLNINTL